MGVRICRRPKMTRSRYQAGAVVRIRSAAEIAATLTDDGLLDGLPFMPEMAAFCGRVFSVRSSAHKTCDSAGSSGMRRMDAAVHLEGLHCDGSVHGGCQSRCPVYLKDAWLEPAQGASAASDRAPSPPTDHAAQELLRKATRSVSLRDRRPGEGMYSCQATEVPSATSSLPFFAPRQYWDDVRSGNITVAELFRGVAISLFNRYQRISTHRLPRWLLIRGGHEYPEAVGTLARGPDLALGLEPGEAVEIRSHEEILATLDTAGTTRGLGLDRDMIAFCGRQAIVHHRVELRIDEHTGELKRLRNPCVVLDSIACRGAYHRFCPRGIDSYWREVWLRRSESEQAASAEPNPG